MISDQARFERRDWMMAAFFFLVALALRIPFRSQMAYHWDSAQFALAIATYDMRLSQPHAPGYFLYVVLGRLVNHFVGDPHASLVWVSVVFGSALPSIVYLLATAMFGRRAGSASGLLALTSPLVWFHSCVALTYVVDSFLVCLSVLVLWRAMERGGEWRYVVTIGVLLAVIGGIRQQSVPGLLPLVIFAFWRFRHSRMKKLGVAVLVMIGLGVLWFVPMVRTSGGIGTYLKILQFQATHNIPKTFFGGGLRAFVSNVAYATAFCWNGLVLAVAVLVGALFYRTLRMAAEQKRAWDDRHALALGVLAVWIVPMILLWTMVVIEQPGHVLNHLPGWFVLTGAAIAQLNRGWRRMATVFVVCAANVVAFVAWPPQWDGVFFGMGRTAREINTHDVRLSQMVSTIRRLFEANEVVVCHVDESYFYGLKHFQLCLPDYDNYQLTVDPTIPHPVGKSMWRARNGVLEFVGGLDLGGTKGIVLLVPPGENMNIFRPYFPLEGITCLTEGTSNLYFLSAKVAQGRQGGHLGSKFD